VIKHIFFDAANTLIHKPVLWVRLDAVFKKHGFNVEPSTLRRTHKLLSEEIKFPDRTSKEFYSSFNARLLRSLGLPDEENMLSDIFDACTYLPWVKFDDTAFLSTIKSQDLNIISNFNSSLKQTIEKEFGSIFKNIFISEDHKLSKPDPGFYRMAVEKAGVVAEECLYIGDSIKLDVEPSLSIGMKALLIDRDEVYPEFQKRIVSLEQLTQHL
jgi:HAD superfamily hydrolase (TIGR01509 family)